MRRQSVLTNPQTKCASPCSQSHNEVPRAWKGNFESLRQPNPRLIHPRNNIITIHMESLVKCIPKEVNNNYRRDRKIHKIIRTYHLETLSASKTSCPLSIVAVITWLTLTRAVGWQRLRVSKLLIRRKVSRRIKRASHSELIKLMRNLIKQWLVHF